MEPQQAAETNFREIKISEARLSEAKAKEAKLAEAKLMSISIAMVMAVVAMLGAVTAYRAALAEQETLRVERRLQQGVMLELEHRQELLSKVSSRARYEHSQELHKNQADRSWEEARKVSATDPRQAALLNLQAEEESAYVRSLNPYLSYFYVADDPAGFEAAIAKKTALYLREWGFDTVWNDPTERDGSSSSMWEHLEATVKRDQTRVLHLATAVVLFVLGLAFLTFAQLSHDKPKREKMLARFGGLLALVGLIVAVRADPDSLTTFLKFSIGFGVLAVVGTPLARKFHFAAKADCEAVSTRVRPGTSGTAAPAEADDPAEEEDDEPVHPAEVEPALFAGMRLHTAPVAHKFGRFVIYMIAISAVLSALSGFFYSQAAVNSSRKAGEALQNLEDLFKKNSDRVTTWNYMVGRLATAEDYHLRYEAARQRLELAKEAPSLLSEKDASEQLRLRRKTLDDFEKKEPDAHRLLTSDLGPEQDANFPWKLVSSQNLPGSQSLPDRWKAVGRWSINNEMSAGYQREATSFLALLTLFAIALYLLGQALGMGRTSAAFILVLFACGLVGAGVVRGLFIGIEGQGVILRSPPPECQREGHSDGDLAEMAADDFANGMAKYETSTDDHDGSVEAAKEFHCAIQIHPKFALANLYYALATNRANTPQLNEGAYVSLIAKNSLDDIYQHEQQAIEALQGQGALPPNELMVDYGFNLYAGGLVKGDRKALDRGKQATIQAIGLDENDLVTRFNLGVAQLAGGQEKEARETYRKAVELGDGRDDPFVTNDGPVVGGAITDLEVLRQYCQRVNKAEYCRQVENTDLRQLKSELVAAAWPFEKGRTLATSGIKISGFHLRGSAAGLGWSAHVENVAPDPKKPRDQIVLMWYAYDPEWKVWRVLPEISEPVRPEWAQGDTSIFYSVLRGSDARMCLQGGSYRAELYVDGELAGTQEITLKGQNLQPVMFPDMSLAVCRPPSWQRWQPRDRDSVWIRGFVEDGKARGVFVFTFLDPQLDGDAAPKEKALQRAETILHNEGLTPGPVGESQIYDCAGLRGNSGDLIAAFGEGGERSIARAWMTREKLVKVGVVVDKNLDWTGLTTENPSQPQTRQDCEILLSATGVR